MSGDILIVDSVATNRIILKVKLSTAFYSVLQAGTASGALDQCRRKPPALVLAAANSVDMECADLIAALHALPGCGAVPIVALIAGNDPETRLRLLREGAADVLSCAALDSILLARIRCLLRDTQSDADLELQPATAEVFGFADAVTPFATQRWVAAVAPCRRSPRDLEVSTKQTRSLLRTLNAQSRHRIDRFDICTAKGLRCLPDNPDALLIEVGHAQDDPGLALLADLRTAPQTRNARRIALVEQAQSPLAATLLDVGAHDVIGLDTPIAEIECRLTLQMQRKAREDALRTRLKTGLQAAVTDPLTGLYNRRFAMTQLTRLLSAAPVEGTQIAVMMADIDHFKQVNDRYGHAAGDAVLTKVAEAMRMTLNPDDVLARIGGEEFMILLPGTTPSAARAMGRRLCHTIRETPVIFASSAEPVHVTISIGVTMTDTAHHRDMLSADALFNQADRALYGSKSDGRDTVTFNARPAA